MLNHVREEQLVLSHSLKRFDQVRLQWKVVANPLGDAGKKVNSSFVHQSRLLGHVLKVHGVVEEILFECEKERAEFDGTLSTRLKLRENYSAKMGKDVVINNVQKLSLER